MVIIDNHNLHILLVIFSLNLIIQLFIKKLVHVFVRGIPYPFLRTVYKSHGETISKEKNIFMLKSPGSR